jgi:hypothetical protein
MSEKKIYNFRFDVVESWKASFEASSDEEAAKLFKQLIDGDINGEDLPEYTEKNSGIDTDYESYGLEDAAGNPIALEENEEPND